MFKNIFNGIIKTKIRNIKFLTIISIIQFFIIIFLCINIHRDHIILKEREDEIQVIMVDITNTNFTNEMIINKFVDLNTKFEDLEISHCDDE